MGAFGALVSIAGLFWLTRVSLAEMMLRNLDRNRDLPADQVAARGRLLEWLAALPTWPGAALIVIGGAIIWL
ncbi:hypothetical protein [Ensifer sp.]|jgi:hypothetical protein|uniref:hypothetical protein n=1 Tax=Ensifer sp. TaxID=1872086 RepID=UPI002E13D3CB|nr:hypothetical protein [Ensifer sp.]